MEGGRKGKGGEGKGGEGGRGEERGGEGREVSVFRKEHSWPLREPKLLPIVFAEAPSHLPVPFFLFQSCFLLGGGKVDAFAAVDYGWGFQI